MVWLKMNGFAEVGVGHQTWVGNGQHKYVSLQSLWRNVCWYVDVCAGWFLFVLYIQPLGY